MITEQLTAQQLPRTCLVVWQQAWTFVVELREKGQTKEQAWCKTFDELVTCVTGAEVLYLARKQTLATYLLADPNRQRYETLGFERALALSKSE
ncbi:hypothetical protein [Hymenobacter sp.]|uniref:hypothetical protein n=1 Tax=Hymenobacter sp. TaxID=1898978 RepID=UPI00286C3301|nr:hypothetical protein [Hymenobacter sp.]